MINLDNEMQSKEQAEEFLRDVIMKYLTKLQSGVFGIPTIEELMNAGNLHSFLEKMYEEKP